MLLALIFLLELLIVVIANVHHNPTLSKLQSHNHVLSCITPNNDQGVCVQVRNCPVIVNTLSAGNSQCHEFIRASQCGPYEQNPSRTKICCGMYPDYLERLPLNSCTTPNRDLGQCMEMRQCSVFIEGLILRKTDNYDFIRESHCGFQNGDQNRPKVCCGLHADYLYKITPKVIDEASASGTKRRKSTAGQSPFPQFCGNHSEVLSNILLDSRIYGGDAARMGEFPWMARLRHIRSSDGYQQFGCAGFLISERFVLTAAHCILSKVMLSTFGPVHQVVLGEHQTKNDPDCEPLFDNVHCADRPQYLRAGAPIVHPDYSDDNQQHNDIAIVPLEETAQLSDYVYPICLSRTHSKESTMWVSGWGKTETADSSQVKLKVSMPRVDTSHCIRQYGRIGVKVLDKQLCAGGEYGRDTCQGDSGGPIMVKSGYRPWHAEGIVSFGMQCGLQGWPGIYTSIPQYIPWIEQVVHQYLGAREQENYNSGNDRYSDFPVE